jgi:hypothetical protein
MDIDIRRGSMLGLFGLLTATCAFHVGKGKDAGARGDRGGEDPAARSVAGGALQLEGDKEDKGQDRRRVNRKVNTVGRFISFTRRLSRDELLRLLPEVSEKMNLAEVREALARLQDMRPGPGRRLATFELIGRWAQLDPEAALAHIADLSDPKMRHDLRLKGIEGWASQEPAAALEFALEAEVELVAKSKEEVKAGFAKTRDLDSAFKFITSLASDANPAPGWTVAQGVEALYQNDDQAVILWVERLPPGEVREQAVVGMVNQWARHDPDSASQWVEEHADPATLDRN